MTNPQQEGPLGAIGALALLALLGIDVTALAGMIQEANPKQMVDDLKSSLKADVSQIEGLAELLQVGFNKETEGIGTVYWKAFVDEPLNIEGSPGFAQAADAATVIKRMLGFSAQLPMVTAALETILHPILGQRAPAIANLAIGRLSEEFGINFFLGTVLSSIFEQAIGRPLEEAINMQHHPARFDPREVRLLLHQHLLSDNEANDLLNKLGYPPELVDTFKRLDIQFMPIGDLQTAYDYGLINESFIIDHLHRVGFGDADVSIMLQLITTKSQTEGGNFLRSQARTLFLNRHISQSQFVTALEDANIPAASINLEVEAVNLVHSINRTSLTVSEIRTAYTNGDISRDAAMQDLIASGYSDTDANTVISEWERAAQSTRASLPQNRVLTYLLSEVINAEQAYNMLIKDGVRPEDASFLVAHPSSEGTVYKYNLTPATVIAAFKDGVLDIAETQSKLHSLNVSPEEANLEIATAVAQRDKKKTAKGTEKELTVGDIHSFFKNGLIADSAAHRMLTQLGYADTNAALLVALWVTEVTGALPDGWTVIQ